MSFSFDPRAGLKALMILWCALAATAAGASLLTLEQAQDLAVLRDADCRMGRITVSGEQQGDSR